MQFANIMPMQAMPRFGRATRYHMALAQYLNVPEYLKFFLERLEDGDTVIMDNGAYEGVQIMDSELAMWARRLRPTVVVLPDSPGNLIETFRRSKNFLDKWGVPKEAMTVLHAEDGKLSHFEVAYGLIFTEWVGFSRLTRSYSLELKWPEHRWRFAAHLKHTHQWRPQLKHHALGMLNGNIEELRCLNLAGFHSCDSSAPIWRGMHGYALDDRTWPNYAFEPSISADNWIAAEYNLKQVLGACDEASSR